jgi:hypothetical protein
MCSFAALLVALLPLQLLSQTIVLKGRVTDPKGNALPKASVKLLDHNRILVEATTGPEGQFQLPSTSAGQFVVKVDASGFRPVTHSLTVRPGGAPDIEISMKELSTQGESVTVTADVNEGDVLSPDPAMKVFASEDLLDANPGRPGAPISVPGYPIETASSGIKAPQYFAPGVAGDHGEPIAQYISVGSYLVPNNLSANAHGNGYSDPNIYIADVIESVQVDGGSFNVREGNHSVNLAATYGLRSHLEPFVTVTGDQRDLAAVAGISPSQDSWIAVEAAYGNGFLKRLEHRQQYKINGERVFHIGDHRLTLFGIGYYGFSYMAGLVPIYAFNSADAGFTDYGDSIDPRQKDQTHTALVALNDVWKLRPNQEFQLSGFGRTYNLSLYTNFGLGLIRQSEFRTVAGGSAVYVNKISMHFTLLAGIDYQREAPRRDNLDHYNFFNPSNPYYYGPFAKVDGNNVTIASVTPYIAGQGSLSRFVHYYLGWRRDEIGIDNVDLVTPSNSSNKFVGLNSPKATVSFLPEQSWFLPLVSVSYGESFFTEDPRIGAANQSGVPGIGGVPVVPGVAGVPGSPVATAHSYQLVASKTIHKTDLKLTLGHVTQSAELAKIDPDTGLQFDQGPSRLRFAAIAIRQSFRYGSLLATFSKADARDLDSGQPTPEAPRTIGDLTGTFEKLPFRLQAKGEYEYVARKPVGTGCDTSIPGGGNAECVGVPVKEFRASLVRPFFDGRLNVGVNMLIASGFTGQTTENFWNFATQQANQVQEVVGVRIPSYASVNLTYRFGRAVAP